MKPRRSKPRVAKLVPILLTGIAIWVVGECMDDLQMSGTPIEVIGRHVGVALDLSAVGPVIRVGWGWPFARWEVSAASHGNPVETGHECFGFLLGIRGADYNGVPSVMVRWYLLGIPWWFIGALAAAALPAFVHEEAGVAAARPVAMTFVRRRTVARNVERLSRLERQSGRGGPARE
jgi:hypothetical protein